MPGFKKGALRQLLKAPKSGPRVPHPRSVVNWPTTQEPDVLAPATRFLFLPHEHRRPRTQPEACPQIRGGPGEPHREAGDRRDVSRMPWPEASRPQPPGFIQLGTICGVSGQMADGPIRIFEPQARPTGELTHYPGIGPPTRQRSFERASVKRSRSASLL